MVKNLEQYYVSERIESSINRDIRRIQDIIDTTEDIDTINNATEQIEELRNSKRSPMKTKQYCILYVLNHCSERFELGSFQIIGDYEDVVICYY